MTVTKLDLTTFMTVAAYRGDGLHPENFLFWGI
jgi:hypothetical protein